MEEGVVEAARVLVHVPDVLVPVPVVVDKMTRWTDSIKKIIFSPMEKAKFPTPGMHHYIFQDKKEKARVHLRIDPTGEGTLLVNASRLYHFNQTATFMAYLALEKISEGQAVKALARCYQVKESQAHSDYQQFLQKIDTIIQPDGICPTCELELETTLPFSSQPTAPYRMDLALTYRCNNKCAHCYNDKSRIGNELTTKQWKHILDKLWDIGVPHIIFTGGEPTLRPDLAELITHAENNGQITGLNTNGRKFKDFSYVEELVYAGLDHVQITLESHDPSIHDEIVGISGAHQDTVSGIRNALKSSLYVMTNSTLLRNNSSLLDQLLLFLVDLGVPTVGLNSLIHSGGGLTIKDGLLEEDLLPLLENATTITNKNAQRLIWYTPTQYCHFNPLENNLGVKGCTAALYNMCVEPDGSVIPCQSYYSSLGNLLTHNWENIWNHDLANNLRERKNVPFLCQSCALVQECGGGCPLARANGAYSKPNPVYSPIPVEKEPIFYEPLI